MMRDVDHLLVGPARRQLDLNSSRLGDMGDGLLGGRVDDVSAGQGTVLGLLRGPRGRRPGLALHLLLLLGSRGSLLPLQRLKIFFRLI